MSPTVDNELAAYANRYPTEDVPEWRPSMPVHCAAVLCDDLGRVLQRKHERVWQFPMAEVTGDQSLYAVVARALGTQMGITDTSSDPEPIEVARRGDGLVVSFRFTNGGPPPASVAATARWSPYDTILNQRLGSKLSALSATRL